MLLKRDSTELYKELKTLAKSRSIKSLVKIYNIMYEIKTGIYGNSRVQGKDGRLFKLLLEKHSFEKILKKMKKFFIYMKEIEKFNVSYFYSVFDNIDEDERR